MRQTTTLSRNEDGTFNLLIQDERGRVSIWERGIPFREAVAEIENRMYLEGRDKE